MKKRKEYDILWKGVMEEVFSELLEFVFPHQIETFDLDRGFEYMDKELGELFPKPEKRSEVRHVDKLVKAYRKDGTDEYVLIHVEVQGAYEKDFAKRMFEYYCRLYVRFKRPIEALAIFTDRDGVKMQGYCEQMAILTRMRLDFQTLYLAKYDDQVLAASDNTFAIVLLAAKEALITGKNKERKLLAHKMLVFKLLLKKGLEKPKIKAVLSFLNNYVPFEEEENFRNFITAVDQLTGKTNTMGIIEQVAEIRVEERARQVIKNLLERTTFSAEEIAQIVGEPVAFVYEVKAEAE